MFTHIVSIDMLQTQQYIAILALYVILRLQKDLRKESKANMYL